MSDSRFTRPLRRPTIPIRMVCGAFVFALALPLFNLTSYADESDIHQETVERRDSGGSVVARVEKIFRGRTLIMETHFLRGSNGTMTVDSRNFYVGGCAVMSESKSNPGDSGLGMLTLYRFDTNSIQKSDVEAFIRGPNGSVKPVSTQILSDYKKVMAESFTFFQIVGGSATNRIQGTVVSPDKRLKAIIFSRDYGALSSFNRQVAVIANSQPSFEYDADKILLSLTADGTASTNLSRLNVSWTSLNELHIRYPIGSPGSGPRLVGTNSPNQSIKVVYESFKVE